MKHTLDDLDVSILGHLEADGRRSYSEIADALGVAVSTVSSRVAKLIERNVVSITAIINPQEVGMEAPATLLIAIQPRYFDDVVETVIGCPEVTYASMTTGRHNLIVDVLCRDAHHLAELVTDRLYALEGIQDINVAFQLQKFSVEQAGVSLIEFEKRTNGATEPEG
ncbi:MAG: Lrp/AsnC family transcriptional regulator [Actinomycetia bacterium]|nr:Lrp/AsnC family transcriptional regulator [Actinomycetes bacterium]